MPRTRVVVTGLGCISPLGNSLATTWELALAGKSGVGPITMFDASDLKTRFAAEVKGFDAQEALGRREARRMDRYTQLAAVAVQQAVEDAGLSINDNNRDRVGVILGTGMGGAGTLVSETRKFLERGPRWVSPYLVPMMLPDASPGQIAIMLGARGPNMSVVTACASGTNAIGEAAEMIRRGAADVMLAGGSEAGIVDVAVAGFSVMDALSSRNDDPQRASRPFDEDRDGFVIGEGAAFLVLERWDHRCAQAAGRSCDESHSPSGRPRAHRRSITVLRTPVPGAGRRRPAPSRLRRSRCGSARGRRRRPLRESPCALRAPCWPGPSRRLPPTRAAGE